MYKSKNQSGGITVRIYKFIFPVSLVLAGVSLAKEELYYFYISNHDQSPSHRVIHPIVGKTNFVYDAKGHYEEVRGEGIAFLIRDCENVTIRNLRLDYARPMLTETKIAGFDGGKTILDYDRKRCPMMVKDGKLFIRHALQLPMFQVEPLHAGICIIRRSGSRCSSRVKRCGS